MLNPLSILIGAFSNVCVCGSFCIKIHLRAEQTKMEDAGVIKPSVILDSRRLMDKQEPLMTTADVSQLKKEDAYSQTGG